MKTEISHRDHREHRDTNANGDSSVFSVISVADPLGRTGVDMAIKVQIPTPMRQHTEGKTTVEAAGATVKAVLDDLGAKYPGHRRARLRERPGAAVRQPLSQQRGHSLSRQPRHAGQGRRRAGDHPRGGRRLTTRRTRRGPRRRRRLPAHPRGAGRPSAAAGRAARHRFPVRLRRGGRPPRRGRGGGGVHGRLSATARRGPAAAGARGHDLPGRLRPAARNGRNS